MDTTPALVVNVSLTGPDRDYDVRVRLFDRPFRVLRIGTGGDVGEAERLVRRWQTEADAIAVTGAREARAVGLYDGEPAALDRLKRAVTAVPVTDGHALHDVLQEWAIRHVQAEMPGYFDNARTLVLGGENHRRTVRVLREFTDNVQYADPLLRLHVPALRDVHPVVGLAASVGTWPVRALPDGLRKDLLAPGRMLAHALARNAARDSDVVVASYDELTGFGLEDLAGKALVTSAISAERLSDLADRGVDAWVCGEIVSGS